MGVLKALRVMFWSDFKGDMSMSFSRGVRWGVVDWKRLCVLIEGILDIGFQVLFSLTELGRVNWMDCLFGIT